MTTTYDQSTVTYDQSSLTYQGLPTQFDGVSFAVEMAFGYEPLDDDPSWESVTPYVRGFDINRGRNSEFTTYGPGTVSIALDNRDRRFDPEYTSGPYFGQLNPMVPVRVQATYSGVTYTMFYGFVQGWPTIYNQSNTDAVASVAAIDANRLLGNTILQRSIAPSSYQTDVVAQSPTLYYPLQETSGPTATPLVIPATFTNQTESWTGSNSAFDSLYPVTFTTMLDGGFSISTLLTTGFFSSMPRVTCFWVDLQDEVFLAYRQAAVRFVNMTLRSGNAASDMRVHIEIGANAWDYEESRSLNISPGPHFVVLTVDASKAYKVFDLSIDGRSVWAETIDGSGALVAVGGAFSLSGSPVSHVAWFSGTPDLDALYFTGVAPFAGELSSVRLERLLDDASWPTALRDIETGVQPVGGYRVVDAVAKDYTTQVDNAEQGSLFVNREGDVEFRSRTTAEAVQVVGLFDDAGTDLPFANVTVDAHTVDAIRNNVIVTYANGSTTSTDAGSVAAYGQASQTIDARLVDDATVAQSIGDTLLARAKDPRTRVTRLDVNVRRDPAGIVPVVAALDLSDDVTVSLTPTGVGSALWRAVRVQGISHRVTPQSWDVSLYLAPGPVNTNGPLMILDDGTYGVLDSNKLG